MDLKTPIDFENFKNRNIEYETPITGKVLIYEAAAKLRIDRETYIHPILAGVCRNAHENDIEPPTLKLKHFEKTNKEFDYPQQFEEKRMWFLKYLYKSGGNEYRKFEFLNVRDYSICYCQDHDEFDRIMDSLKDLFLIDVGNESGLGGFRRNYINVKLTSLGMEEAKKALPKMPMIKLVNDDIETSDSEVDNTINHAKKLFFQEPQTLENMRSACESLSRVLEPIRTELTSSFSSKDVNDFFQIVNTFDIRHNKDHTKNIEMPEQLEWVFYTLLNTISTYIKIKNKY